MLAAETFHAKKALDAEWHGRAIWAQALLAQEKVKEAEQLILPIRTSAAKSENARTRLHVAVAAAGVRAAAGAQADLYAARQELERARDEVDKLGLLPEHFNVNLAPADVMQRLGEKDVVRNLERLANEAHAIGFGLYEKKARSRLTH